MAIGFSPLAATKFPTGGHHFSPLVAIRCPHWWPSNLPTNGEQRFAEWHARPPAHRAAPVTSAA